MGTSAHGHLMYGYDIAGYDQWAIQEVDEDGCLKLDWYDNSWSPYREDDPEDQDTFVEACQKRLLVSVGITENPNPDKYFDLEELVKEHFGVEFFWYGNVAYSATNCVLGTSDTYAYGYGAEIIDLAELAIAPEYNGWDERLARAIEVLGITPKQAKPAWILTSTYG